MNEQINIGLNKILKGSLPEYGFLNPKHDLHEFVVNTPANEDQENLANNSIPTDILAGEGTKENLIKVVHLEEIIPVMQIPQIPLSPMESAFKNKEWTRLSELSEEAINLEPSNFVAKSYWSFSALKLKTLRADLVGFGLISIWQDELQNLPEEKRLEVTNILIPTSKLALEQCLVIDPELASKLETFIPKTIIHLEKHSVLPEVPEFIDTPQRAEVDPEESQLDEFQKYLNSLNTDKNLELITADLQLPAELIEDYEQEVSSSKSIRRYKPVSIILMLLFISLLISSIYFYTPRERQISLVSDPNFVKESLELIREKPRMVLKTTEVTKTNAESPLTKIMDQLENPDSGSSNTKQSLDDLTQPQGLNLTGPVEPAELRDILDGYTPEDAVRPSKENQPETQGNNVMDEHLRKTPIIDERVGQAKLEPTTFKNYQVRVVLDTSLYIKPSTFEAEVMPLYYGDRLLVIEDHGDWLKVDAFGRVVGYVEKYKVN